MLWQHTVTIDAPARLVWQLTIDVEKWPHFTPTMHRVERLDDGPFGLGSSAKIKQPDQPAAVWTVTHFVDGREFAWQRKAMGMTMTAAHLVEESANGCRNTLTLSVAGRGSKLFGLAFGWAVARSLAAENAAFQAEAARVGGSQ